MKAMIEAKRQATAEGAILFDAAVLAQAGAGAFDPAWFDAGALARQQRASDVAGGRGSVSYVDAPFGCGRHPPLSPRRTGRAR